MADITLGSTGAAPATPRFDWPFLIGAVAATVLLMALVLLDGQPASAMLLLSGFGLGVVFLKAEFSFTAAWRRFIVRGEAGGLLAGLLVVAIAAVVIVPMAALLPGYGGAIAPLGPSLIVGAAVFGVGMQLANGCGSGTLYTAGGGSGRMLITLACFIAGSVIGSLHLPAMLALGGIDPILAADYLGPWGGLVATLASLALAAMLIVAVARRRGATFQPRRALVIGGVLVGLLSIAVFLAGGHPWSVTFGLTVWGAKIASALGFDFSHAAFWQWPGPKRALGDSILSDTSSLDRPRHDLRRDGGSRGDTAVRARGLATGEVAAGRGDRRAADGLGCPHRFRLQHRRIRRRCCLRFAARLDLAGGGLCRKLPRHFAAAVVRIVAGTSHARRLCHRVHRRPCGAGHRPPRQSIERPREIA